MAAPSLVLLRSTSAKHDTSSPLECLCLQLIYARAFLKEVQIKNDQVKYLVQNARNGQCQGHRAELFAVRAAKASAAVAVSWVACTAGLEKDFQSELTAHQRLHLDGCHDELGCRPCWVWLVEDPQLSLVV